MNYKKLKVPTPIGKLLDNTKFKFADGEMVGHFIGGKVFVNGVEYGADVQTLGGLNTRLTSNPEYVCYPLNFNKAFINSYGRKFFNDRIDRAQLRRDKRNRSYDERQRLPHGDSRCPHCGGQMSWCSCCQMWSSNCCIAYGTCQCS